VSTSLFCQIEGGLWGLLVGDAVGVPYEFHRAGELPPRTAIEMVPIGDFPRSYADVPLGTWSDDGAQALCLAASLVECQGWNAEDFAARLLAWFRSGSMAVDGKVFDVGIQTGAALNRLEAGASPEESGLSGERNNGNGSLMRALPAALLHRGDAESLVAVAHAQSAVTHAHPRAQVCCALYCLWARKERARTAEPWNAAVATLRGIYASQRAYRDELEDVIIPAMNPLPTGSGYVVDALHSARVACEESSFAEIVQAAVAFGNDTDTTACLAGGIAGIRHGKRGIPAAWINGLRGRAILDPLLERIRAFVG